MQSTLSLLWQAPRLNFTINIIFPTFLVKSLGEIRARSSAHVSGVEAHALVSMVLYNAVGDFRVVLLRAMEDRLTAQVVVVQKTNLVLIQKMKKIMPQFVQAFSWEAQLLESLFILLWMTMKKVYKIPTKNSCKTTVFLL